MTVLEKKQLVVDEIKDKFSKAQSAVVVDYLGITVAEADAMRKKLRESDVDYKVYKNTLVARAIEGTELEGLKEVLKGSSALAFAYEDATAPARILNGVIKEYKKMAFKAGVVEGKICTADEITAIANLPTREEMIAKFMGSIQSPVSKFAYLMQAIADQKAEGSPAAPVEEEPVVAATEEVAASEPVAEDAAPAEETPAE